MPFKLENTSTRILILVWSCFLIRGLFYSLLFPIWEGYDEYAHFAFVQHLVVNHALPAADRTLISREVEESLKLLPLPWTHRELAPPHITHDEYWRLPQEERIRRQDEFKRLSPELASHYSKESLLNWEAQQPPLYYLVLSLPLRWMWDLPLASRVIMLRLLSLALASLLIPMGFCVVRRVFSSDAIALGLVVVIAAMPELMINLCRVGNESLSILIYTLLIYAVLRLDDAPGNLRIAAALGVALGLGLLTKAYFLTALPALAALFAYRCACAPAGRRKSCFSGLLVLGTAVLVSGWWYWRNHALTGSWSGVMPDVALSKMHLWDILRGIPRVDWMNALDTALVSHIWFGNWSFLQVRSWIYHIFRDFALLSMVGLATLFALPEARWKARCALLASRKQLCCLATIFGCFCLGLLYHILITFLAQGISATQGWYLYCLVVAEVPIVFAGLLYVVPKRLQLWILPAATLGFAILDLYTVHFMFIPYYTGLIAHKASGALATLRFGQLPEIISPEIRGRLLINRPWVGPLGLIMLWVCYLGATLCLMALSIRLCLVAGRRPGSPRAPEGLSSQHL